MGKADSFGRSKNAPEEDATHNKNGGLIFPFRFLVNSCICGDTKVM